MKRHEASIQTLKSMEKWIKENNAKLRIPDLQRQYVWGNVQWEQLWNDIVNVWIKCSRKDENDDNIPQHFMGVIVLKKNSSSNVYDIIDGQQRLTTLIILADCLCYLIRMNNKNYKNGIELEIENLNVVKIPDIPENDSNNTDKYTEVYNYFAGLYSNVREVSPEQLMHVIENRLFWLVQFTDDNEHDVFEAINATGKPLEYADLLLNYLLEKSHDEGNSSDKDEDIKRCWNTVLDGIYSGQLPENCEDIDADSEVENNYEETEGNGENEEEETLCEISEDDPGLQNLSDNNTVLSDTIIKPLKLKKFLSALHSLTLPKTESIHESVEDFERVFIRLKDFCNEHEKKDYQDIFTGFILESMKYWSKLYLSYVDPASNREFKGKKFEEELYLPEYNWKYKLYSHDFTCTV